MSDEFEQFSGIMNSSGIIDIDPAIHAAAVALTEVFPHAPQAFLRGVATIAFVNGMPEIFKQLPTPLEVEEDRPQEPPC